MFEAQTKNLNHYIGTPVGTRRVGWTEPDGNDRSGFVRGVENDWDVSIFVDEETETTFFVATSPDKRKLHIERWLAHHCPRKRQYKTKTAQKDDLGGQDAGTLTHAQIVDAIKDAITENDDPQVAPKPELTLAATTEHKAKRKETKGEGKYKDKVVKVEYIVEQEGTYEYRESSYGKDRTEPCWMCATQRGSGGLMRTKGDPAWPRSVFYNQNKTEIFFLFTKPDGNYLLEALRETNGGFQRREATASKASFGSKKAATVVKEMAKTLVYDPNAFA